MKARTAVVMVGDGINDTPALAAASVGIAQGGGTCCLRGRCSSIHVWGGAARSRGTLANVWRNITIALGLKAVFLFTTLVGMSSVWMAILADTGPTVLVIANALRLLGYEAHRRGIAG